MFDFVQRPSDDEDASAPAPALSVLGESTTARGTFDLDKDDLRVDGVLDGDVMTEGHVHVSEEGAIRGEIQAGSIRIAGSAEGILHARADLIVMDTASVHGILCAEAHTIEEGADFEGGICDTADRIPELRAVFSSAEAYTIPGLSVSTNKTSADTAPTPETAERSVTLDIDRSSPPENISPFRSLQEGDGLPETSSPSAAPATEPSSSAPNAPETDAPDDADSLSKIEW